MSRIRFALIGCGSVAGKHAESLRRIQGAALVAVCDADESKARLLAGRYDVPHYADYHAMLSSEAVDVVAILTPSGEHAEHVRGVLKYRKHIVVEKPMTLRLDDADEIIRGCEDAGVSLFVVQQHRYNRPIQALRAALNTGRFGKLVLGTVRVRWSRTQAYYDQAPWRGTWAWDGGVLANQASHHLDMLTWMLGAPASAVAMTATRLANIEADDTGVAILRFRNGALGVVEATTATRPNDLEGSVSILGEKGSVVVGGFAMDRLVTWQFSESRLEDERIFETHGANPQEFAWNHTEYLRGVVETLETGRKALVDGPEARKSVALINAIYASAGSGRAVALDSHPQSRLGVRPV